MTKAKRITRPDSELMKRVRQLFHLYDFVATDKSYTHLRSFRKVYIPEVYGGTLRVSCRDFGHEQYGEPHVSVTFSGAHVEKERTIEYFVGDIEKLDGRIKRVMREARKHTNKLQEKMDVQNDAYAETCKRLEDIGLFTYRRASYGARAVVNVNGYDLEVGPELTVAIGIGGTRGTKVHIDQAIKIAELLPTRVKDEDDD